MNQPEQRNMGKSSVLKNLKSLFKKKRKAKHGHVSVRVIPSSPNQESRQPETERGNGQCVREHLDDKVPIEIRRLTASPKVFLSKWSTTQAAEADIGNGDISSPVEVDNTASLFEEAEVHEDIQSDYVNGPEGGNSHEPLETIRYTGRTIARVKIEHSLEEGYYSQDEETRVASDRMARQGAEAKCQSCDINDSKGHEVDGNSKRADTASEKLSSCAGPWNLFSPWTMVGGFAFALTAIAVMIVIFENKPKQSSAADLEYLNYQQDLESVWKTSAFCYGLAVGISALGVSAFIYKDRHDKRRDQPCGSASQEKLSVSPQAKVESRGQWKDGLIFTISAILMPVVIIAGTLNAIGHLLKALDTIASFLAGFPFVHKANSKTSHRSSSSRSSNDTVSRSRGQRPNSSQGQDNRNLYKISMGEAVLMIFVPFLIPIICMKARKRNRQLNSSGTNPSGNPGNQSATTRPRGRPSVARSIVQLSISRSLTPGRSDRHYSRSGQIVRPVLAGIPRRPCRCKCTIS